MRFAKSSLLKTWGFCIGLKEKKKEEPIRTAKVVPADPEIAILSKWPFISSGAIPTVSTWCIMNALLTYLLTPWSRVLLEKLTGSQLVKKFHEFYEAQRFITAFTTGRCLSLSWARSIQSMPAQPTSSIYIITLSSHLCLGPTSGLFPSALSTKTQHATHPSSIRATCPAYLSLLYLVTRTVLGEEYI
jgi:hypothetical protein